MIYTKELIERLYKKMFLIRRFELRLAEIYHTDAIKSPIHLSVGQEAVAVGVCDALKQTDIVSNTYRCHATYLAKGGDVNLMMAELYGKQTGCAGGKAGSMHLVDMQQGVMGASAVVGTTIPVATGYALALKRLPPQASNARPIVVAFFGDGGTEEGCFYESLNFASLHQLPIIYICENNGLAIHTPLHKRWASAQLCERVATFGIPAQKLEKADVLTIRETLSKAIHEVRENQHPLFFEIPTYRWLEHVGPLDDHHEAYRDQAGYQHAKAEDSLNLLANFLDPETITNIQKAVGKIIEDAQAFAESSPYPLAEELYTHVYAD